MDQASGQDTIGDASTRPNNSTDRMGMSEIVEENKEPESAARHLVIGNISAQLSSDGRSVTSSTDGVVPVARDEPAQSRLTEKNQPDLLTSRFQHVVTESGHAIITGRDGKDFQFCEDEPIHIPGAILVCWLCLKRRMKGS